MVKQYVDDASDVKLLAEVVFDRLYWDRLDAGTITNGEVIDACKARLPKRLWDKAEQIYYHWIDHIPEIEGMYTLIHRLKEKGTPLFLLSNISVYFADHANNFPILKLFDRCIFSAVCGFVKPDQEIFHYLCKECGIFPEETLFIDDSEKNIAGAKSCGIHGYLFDGDVARLQRYLDETIQ